MVMSTELGCRCQIQVRELFDIYNDYFDTSYLYVNIDANIRYRGEFEDRLKAVLKEVVEADGKIILFIDEIHNLLGLGKSEGAMDAGNLLKVFSHEHGLQYIWQKC